MLLGTPGADVQENERGTPGGVGRTLTASALSCLDPRALGWQVVTEQVQENLAGAIHGGAGTGGPTWSLVIRECPCPPADPRVIVNLQSPGGVPFISACSGPHAPAWLHGGGGRCGMVVHELGSHGRRRH